jgi:alpha-glucosidase (family GH31 glycosyl hydrolase)
VDRFLVFWKLMIGVQNHDEWFLKGSDGNRINWDDFPDHWFMDIGNPEYQDYWVAHMIAKAQDVPAGEDGWDGVYVVTP